MPIVGGLDIHRKQLTFDYLDTATGEVKRGQIAPADRAHLRAWLARFAGRDDVAFALEGCTGWRYVAEELAGAGVAAHVAEPADTAFARGRKRHAKTGKTDSRHLRELLAGGRLPECWIPPSHILECRALLETYHDLRAEHTAWVQRIHAVFFHQGAPALGEGALRTDRDLRGAARGRRRAPVTGRAAAGGYRLGHACRAGGAPGRAAAPAAGCCPEPVRRQGARRAAVRGRPGHRAGDDLLAGRRRPVLLLPQGGPVRRAGRHRLVFGPQGPARAAVPAGARGAALFVRTHRVRAYRCRVSPAVTACGRSGCGAAVASAFGCESGSRATSASDPVAFSHKDKAACRRSYGRRASGMAASCGPSAIWRAARQTRP